MSFAKFMHLLPNTSPTNRVIFSYWQDFENNQPINGGIVYQPILPKLHLDGSIDSLKRIDAFLDKIQPRLAQDIATLQSDAPQRKLLLFLAFYSGMVFAYYARHISKQPQLPPFWVSFAKMTETYEPLKRLIKQDFSYSVAVSLSDIDGTPKPFLPDVVRREVFFPLVAILERLFPQRQFPNPSVPSFGYLHNSVFNSVKQLLQIYKKSLEQQTATPITPLTNNFHEKNLQPIATDLNNPLIDRKTDGTIPNTPNVITAQSFQKPNFGTSSQPVSAPVPVQQIPQTGQNQSPAIPQAWQNKNTPAQPIKIDEKQLAQQQAEQRQRLLEQQQAQEQAKREYALANPQLHAGLLNQRKSILEQQQKRKDSFSELEQDLQTINLPDVQMSEQAKQVYAQSVKLLQYLSQNQQNSNPSLSQKYQKAYQVIDKLAKSNTSDAMLRQALLLFRGNPAIALQPDHQQAVALVHSAAKLLDNRAEKLLSKLYYSGEIQGLQMDSEQGRYWLEQAAKHGHPEAERLLQSFDMLSTLKTNRYEDDDYLKKLGLGTGALVVFAIGVIVFLDI